MVPASDALGMTATRNILLMRMIRLYSDCLWVPEHAIALEAALTLFASRSLAPARVCQP